MTKPTEIGVHDVTQDPHERAMRRYPSKLNGATNPIAPVRIEEAVDFCRQLSELRFERAAGDLYRLPTER